MASRAYPILRGWKKELADDYEKNYGVGFYLELFERPIDNVCSRTRILC